MSCTLCVKQDTLKKKKKTDREDYNSLNGRVVVTSVFHKMLFDSLTFPEMERPAGTWMHMHFYDVFFYFAGMKE